VFYNATLLRYSIGPFLKLYRLIESADMDVNHVKRLLEVAYGELPKVEQTYKNLLSGVMTLNQKKRDAEAAILPYQYFNRPNLVGLNKSFIIL